MNSAAQNQNAAAPYLAMARNNAWANQTLYAALQNLPDAGAFHATRPGFFPSLHATMAHIWQVDLYYLDALEGGGMGRDVYDLPVPSEASELAAAQAETDARLIAFCNALTAEKLDAACQTQRPEGRVTEQVSAVLLHLFQHQTHHRGQAHVQLQSAGIAPPQLDEFHLSFERAPSARRYHSDTDAKPT